MSPAEVRSAAIIDARRGAVDIGSGYSPPFGHSRSQPRPARVIARRQLNRHQDLPSVQARFSPKRYKSKRGRCTVDLDSLAVFQPSLRATEQKSQRVWLAVAVQIEILHQQISQHGKEVCISRTIRRAVEKPAPL